MRDTKVSGFVLVRGAREHNLKNVSAPVPVTMADGSSPPAHRRRWRLPGASRTAPYLRRALGENVVATAA